MTLITTLNAIRAHDPCADGWKKLLAHLGKTKADDEPLGILTILESNGLEDALWSLKAVNGQDRTIRNLACDFAEHVLHMFEDAYPKDDRPRKAIETARLYADGKATAKQLDTAWDTAWDAARDTAWDAGAAGAAARAARAAAWDAGAAAARYAARYAAWAAAWDAGAAAQDAEKQWQAERLRHYCMTEGS